MKSIVLGMIVVGSLTAAQVAWARTGPSDLATRYGMSVFAGGGVGTFVDEDVRDLTGTAGIWEARVNFGTLLPIAVEAAYVGSAQSIDALGLSGDALLVGSGIEANARVNFLTMELVQPYAFVGLGWQRYDLANVDQNLSSVEDTDNTMTVPLGIGVGFRISRALLDVRGTYRPTYYEDLVPQSAIDTRDENLDSWSVALRVGYEF